MLNSVEPAFLLLGGGQESAAELKQQGATVNWSTHEGAYFALVRSRCTAGVVVQERTYEDACIAIEHVRDASRFVPIAVVCEHHEWEGGRHAGYEIHPVDRPGALAGFAQSAATQLRDRHAAIDDYAQRCGCPTSKGELLWRAALGVFHDDLNKAMGITLTTKDEYLKDLRARTGIFELDDMLRVATGARF